MLLDSLKKKTHQRIIKDRNQIIVKLIFPIELYFTVTTDVIGEKKCKELES